MAVTAISRPLPPPRAVRSAVRRCARRAPAAAVRGVSAGVFVVQEHQATAHHFDLRLEVGGAMRSWAVALQRTRGGEKPQWLLIKRKDEFARSV